MISRLIPERAVVRPYFFLSYARTPRLDLADQSDPDRWVSQLYRDLRQHIVDQTRIQPRSAGFMDRNNLVGSRWPGELADALATCRVFVPLYCPRYFASKNCGMEWFAFARREASRRARGLPPANAIVPIIWVPVKEDQMPEVARPIQYDHADLGSRYAADGLLCLIKLRRYRDDYEAAVLHLARRIVEVANETQIRPEPAADYSLLQNSFSIGRARRPRARAQMQITVLAPDSMTLPDGRARAYYGETARKWSPYHPDSSQPLADYAAELTTCFGCESDVGTFDEHNAGWIANGRAIPPGVCLVDPWAAISPGFREKLHRLNETEPRWVSVLLPWNRQDTELTAAEQQLRQEIVAALNRKLGSVPRRCRMAATGIPTLSDFADILPQMAMIMMKRYRKGKNGRAYSHKDQVDRPRLRRTEL
jgi:FxsC-like protein